MQQRKSNSGKKNAVQVRSKSTGATYVVAESRMSQLPREKVKSEKLSNGAGETKNPKSKNKGSASDSADDSSYEVLEKFSGASLVGSK